MHYSLLGEERGAVLMQLCSLWIYGAHNWG